MTDRQVFGIVFVGIGLIAFAVPMFFQRRAILLHHHGVTTDAVVLAVKKHERKVAPPIAPMSASP